jgi:hypothetical protein
MSQQNQGEGQVGHDQRIWPGLIGRLHTSHRHIDEVTLGDDSWEREEAEEGEGGGGERGEREGEGGRVSNRYFMYLCRSEEQ